MARIIRPPSAVAQTDRPGVAYPHATSRPHAVGGDEGPGRAGGRDREALRPVLLARLGADARGARGVRPAACRAAAAAPARADRARQRDGPPAHQGGRGGGRRSVPPALMPHRDVSLARRLEESTAAPAADFARALGRIRPGAAAAAEPIAGGFAIYAGVGSPLTIATGLGMAGEVGEGELDRLEAFFRPRRVTAPITLFPLAQPSLFDLLG